MPREAPETPPAGAARPAAPVPPGKLPTAPGKPKTLRFLLLSVGALGVIYGDIGTSPLYAVRESFSGTFGVNSSAPNILGVLSLITWSLIVIVALKYQVIVLRAGANEGEGGILALAALVGSPDGSKTADRTGRAQKLLVPLGLFGAALLFGDGMLTPAISVLSAMEGLKILDARFASLVVPLTILILGGLFLLQRRGTGRIGALFGPITLLWFLVIAVLGIRGVLMAPGILAALNPAHAISFLQTNGIAGFLVLGAVFLVVTGSEALYADLGHFGPGPIQFSWFTIAGPALLLNYFGQGALVLSNPTTASSPFFLLAPPWALIPLIVLSTAATIIASQAIISGMFSLAMQAVQLGYWPRLEIRHTSAREFGQVYVPSVNWALFIGTLSLVVAFRSSGGLAAAYGIAIITTMLVTTILLYSVLPQQWGWPRWLSATLLTVFLIVELAFFGANIVKVQEGGWVPLLLAAVVFVMMTTWHDGRAAVGQRITATLAPLEPFIGSLETRGVVRVQGSAVFMTSNPAMTPPALLMMIRHQHVVHKRVVILSIENVRTPRVKAMSRVQVEELPGGFHRVVARYGFLEKPDVIDILERLRAHGIELPLNKTTFVLGRERVAPPARPLWARWRIALFSFMSRESQRATAYFNIPPERVVEVGSQIEVEPS